MTGKTKQAEQDYSKGLPDRAARTGLTGQDCSDSVPE
jgi:hypothetical protein